MVYGAFSSSCNGRITDDEFYTRREDIDNILKYYKLIDKKVYLCCDSDNSNYVKYCIDNKINYINTSDDYKNHEDLFNWSDVIITNPPFSKFAEFYRYIKKFNKKFIILCSTLSLANNELVKDCLNERLKVIDKVRYFIRPDGAKRSVNAVCITNIMNKDKEWRKI